jgi:charged multivesicular body protein 5
VRERETDERHEHQKPKSEKLESQFQKKDLDLGKKKNSKMRRIFGISKDRKKKDKKKEEGEEEPPKPTVGEISGKTDARIQGIEQKIADCDKKLVPLKRKIKRTKGAAKLRYKKQAMMILKRRKMYEKQLDNLSAMHLNTLSIVDTIENAKATQEMAVAMKESVKTLKEQQEQFSLDDMEDVYDDMDDIMMDQEEIQDIMGRSLGDMEDVDEDELEAELEGIDDELDAELDGLTEDVTPSYIDVPIAPDTKISDPTPTPVATTSGVDEYGLPVVPTPASATTT